MERVKTYRPISRDYFARPTLEVAEHLPGAFIVRTVDADTRLVARIVETEAYTEDDPACHGWQLRENSPEGALPKGKGAELFGPPGTAYVYLCYGIHWLFNVVTEPEGTCGAVLIRAVEPVEGLDFMREQRAVSSKKALTNGPGKLTQALAIDDRFHEQMLTESVLYLSFDHSVQDLPITSAPRVGISRGTERKWRFFIEGNAYVSRG